MLSGILIYAYFSRTALCRTLSKAFEKSRAKTTTNGLVSSRVVMEWMRWMTSRILEITEVMDIGL